MFAAKNNPTSAVRVFKRSEALKATKESFYLSQWNIHPAILGCFRIAILVYWSIVFVLSYLDDKEFFFVYLSHLHQLVIWCFFISASLCSIHGMVAKRRRQKTQEKTEYIHVDDKSLFGDNRCLRWFHGVTWVLYCVSLNTAFIVTFLYPFLSDGREDGLFNSYNFCSVNIHLVNVVILLIELFLNRIPINYWHFLATACFSLLYAVLLSALHFSGTLSAVYSVIDYDNKPAQAWIITAAMIFVAPALCNLVICGVYIGKIKLYACVSSRCTFSNDVSDCSCESSV